MFGAALITAKYVMAVESAQTNIKVIIESTNKNKLYNGENWW